MSLLRFPASAQAFAPGGIGNLGPGLDILGCALTGSGDTVLARFVDAPGVLIAEPGHPELPRDATLHASGIAAAEVLRRAGAPSLGVSLTITKGLPLAGGQGGSSASAVAGAVATNALIGSPLTERDLLLSALAAEERVAGRHLDNIAPALLGGIVLVHSVDPVDIVRLPVPACLRVVIVHPAQRLRTAQARAVLPQTVERTTALAQAASVASVVSALYTGDLALLKRAIDDRIAEPSRVPLLPGFVDAKRAALDAGAFGCSISGAGPSAFAFADSDEAGERIAAAMCAAYARVGVAATSRVAQVDECGARVQIG
jgi:homoserine kinase